MSLVDHACLALVRAFARRTPRRPPSASRAGRDPMFRRTGSSFDLKTIREYDPSDDPRRIDWRLEARTGRLFVKDYHEEEVDGIVVLADLSSSLDILRSPPVAGGSDALPVEEVAASLAWVLAALGLPLLLLAFADAPLRALERNRGALSSGKLEAFFAGLAAEGRRKTDIAAAVASARGRSRFRRVIIVSDFLDPRFDPSRSPFARSFFLRLHRPLIDPSPGVGDLEVEDPESGRVLRLPWDSHAERGHASLDAALEARLASAGRGRNFHRTLRKRSDLVPALWELLGAVYD